MKKGLESYLDLKTTSTCRLPDVFFFHLSVWKGWRQNCNREHHPWYFWLPHDWIQNHSVALASNFPFLFLLLACPGPVLLIYHGDQIHLHRLLHRLISQHPVYLWCHHLPSTRTCTGYLPVSAILKIDFLLNGVCLISLILLNKSNIHIKYQRQRSKYKNVKIKFINLKLK